jgi:hypothetical protein
MTDPRLLTFIKAKVESLHDLDDEDIGLLIRLAEEAQAEVERLRGLLGRLEWEGGEAGWPQCPACFGDKPTLHPQHPHAAGHDPDCWLAAELANRPTSPDPPEDEQLEVEMVHLSLRPGIYRVEVGGPEGLRIFQMSGSPEPNDPPEGEQP